MKLTPELLQVLESIPPDFFGNIEISAMNGHPGVVKVTQTYKLPSRDSRGTDANRTPHNK